MTPVPVSVIVVSRGRPQALVRCLTGLEQLEHPNFEIVVVADAAGMAALNETRFSGRIKTVGFDEPNISKARNLGLSVAAGDVVAFIDDDAVPEPTWLCHLTAPFVSDGVAAAGGFVRGRNGISFQNKARRVDALGDHFDLAIDGDATQVLTGETGNAIKTEGTNCAFRRDVLIELDGFDPAFVFYMDETDLNLRLAASRHKTAIVPLAQVHHGFAASAQRQDNRMPRSLFDVGASHMVLLRKHAPDTDPEPVLNRLRTEQRTRLMRHMVAGTCEPRDVRRVLATLEAGIDEGRSRTFGAPANIGSPEELFQKFEPETPFTGTSYLAGRSWQAGRLRQESQRLIENRQRVSLFLFSPTALFHQVEFTAAGVWEQRGGLWGKSDRKQRFFKAFTFARRLKDEIARIALVRNLGIW